MFSKTTSFAMLFMVRAFEKAKSVQLTDEEKVVYERYRDDVAAILKDQPSWNIMNELNRRYK